MMQVLQEQDSVFGVVYVQMYVVVGQLGCVCVEIEELICECVCQVVVYVWVQECELLEVVDVWYQCDYEEMVSWLGCLDVVLQCICMGSVLVQRMKCYVLDQEVLDMYGFLCQVFCCLCQEEFQSL